MHRVEPDFYDVLLYFFGFILEDGGNWLKLSELSIAALTLDCE